MNSELGTIARELAALYVERGDLLADRIFLKQRLSEIESELAPPEGKNDMERKLNRQIALLSHDEWRELDRIGRENEAQTIKIDAQVQALEAQRRAREWEIRAALAGYTERAGGDGDPDEATLNILTDAPAAYAPPPFDPEMVERFERGMDRMRGPR
jgi:hypothetical protein